MDTPILAGLLTAWTAVQMALGVFFLLAYAARRGEAEYLLFGLVCFAFATTDAGLALGYAIESQEQWPLAVQISAYGAVAAAALNGHFILDYVAPGRFRWIVRGLYVLSAAYVVYIAGWDWFRYDTVRVTHSVRLGIEVNQLTAVPSIAAVSAYAFFAVETAVLGVLLAFSVRRGRREALGMMVGLFLGLATVVNDVMVAVAASNAIYLSPFGFLLYAFGVATTLVARYQNTAAELETKANELREATEELTVSHTELSGVQDELFRRKQLASVGELAASIAHEVRNPLAVIVNAAASLKKKNLTDEDRSTLFGIIQEEIARLNELVTQLLRYARPVNVSRSDVKLDDVLRNLELSMEDGHSMDLDIEDAPQVRRVWADPELLRLVLDNLLDNAKQSMPDGGIVTVSAYAVESERGVPSVAIRIADNGHGMDAETLQRARDPFFTTRPKGTGLGLTIAEQIVQAHDGTVTMTSQEGEGTIVRVELPRRRGEAHSLVDGARPARAVGADGGTAT